MTISLDTKYEPVGPMLRVIVKDVWRQKVMEIDETIEDDELKASNGTIGYYEDFDSWWYTIQENIYWEIENVVEKSYFHRDCPFCTLEGDAVMTACESIDENDLDALWEELKMTPNSEVPFIAKLYAAYLYSQFKETFYDICYDATSGCHCDARLDKLLQLQRYANRRETAE